MNTNKAWFIIYKYGRNTENYRIDISEGLFTSKKKAMKRCREIRDDILYNTDAYGNKLYIKPSQLTIV